MHISKASTMILLFLKKMFVKWVLLIFYLLGKLLGEIQDHAIEDSRGAENVRMREQETCTHLATIDHGIKIYMILIKSPIFIRIK